MQYTAECTHKRLANHPREVSVTSDQDQTLVVRFQDETVADAARMIAELRDVVLDASPEIQAEVRKEDPIYQDFGTTLVLVLGTPAIVALAKGISDYLRLRPAAKLELETPGGNVVFAGSSDAAARIAEALSRKGTEDERT